MTVERLAVAVLLCAGLDATVTGAKEPGMPLSVAVPPSGMPVSVAILPAGKVPSDEDSAAGEPAPGTAPPEDEEYIPLDLPADDGGRPAPADRDPAAGDTATADPAKGGPDDSSPADRPASEAKPINPGQDENPAAAGSYFVHAEIFGVPNGDGVIAASLCTRRNFTKSGCRTERVSARKGQVSVVFDNVAPGSYAVQVHHDQNGNGKMDYTFFGLPKEPYGFSRDARPVLAPPKFKSASFDVIDSDVSLIIHLQNT